MTQCLAEMLQSPEIEKLFEEVTQGNPKAKKALAERLADATLPILAAIDISGYRQCEPDLRQEFLCKILEGKVVWEKSKGKLSTYVGAIVNNLWYDLLRKEAAERKKLRCESILNEPDGLDKPCHADLPSIKPNLACQLGTLSCQERVVLKMSRPYLYAFHFEADEVRMLQERFQVDGKQLAQQLRLELDERLNQTSKPYISAAWIADLLHMNRNTVDQILHRIQKKFPWLKGGLRNALA